MRCFWCEAELEQRGGGNIAIHFACPNGCGAWWPEEDTSDIEALKLWNMEQQYKKSISKRGGSRSGRKRKEPEKIDPYKKYRLPE